MRTQSVESGRSSWEIAALVGLVAAALGPILTMLLDGRFAPFGLIFTVIPLVLAGLVLTRNRWLILVAAILIGIYFLSALRAGPVQYRLTHPELLGYFAVALLEVLGSGLATVAGVGRFIRSVAPRPGQESVGD